ncbi:glycosyltransferase [Mesonia ostreae]|uniref:Glycosyltransferase n=1 Tax=Mesonia ostreae TaxID=861110 RepID=A0ABU2KMB8_9FLAO|nr:glycosyltransferase [Mesonia ostreae]MDT0295849.1 glycosyltransferase [Mesonia ostreae]
MLLYLIVMIWLYLGIQKLAFKKVEIASPSVSFSVCIAFRNEAAILNRLLVSLKNIDYPNHLYEIILINDHSTDESVKICKEFIAQHSYVPFQIIHATNAYSNSPKKEALLKAIHKSTKTYIITTDADCEVPPIWLHAFNKEIIKTSANFVAGPVSYFSEESFLNFFQNLDFLSLQAATLGGFGQQHPFLCNGANLCYKKETFFELDAFNGNEHIASGDDMFLLDKMIGAHKKVVYLASAEAIVYTHATETWKGLLLQRIRWASKTTASKNCYGKSIGGIIFLTNACLMLMAIIGLFQPTYLLLFLEMFVTKLLIDFVILKKAANIFEKAIVKGNYFYVAFIHPFFISITAFLSVFKSYSWKERTFKK